MADYFGESGLLSCESCDMVFRSWALLATHAQRFCIGRLTPEATLATQPSVTTENRDTTVIRAAYGRGRFASKQDSLKSSPCHQIMAQEKSRSEEESSKSALKRLAEEVHTQHGYRFPICR